MANDTYNNKLSNLDIFRAVYTVNSNNEKLSTGDEAANLATRITKVVMVIPFLAQIVAPIVLVSTIATASHVDKRVTIARLSRVALSFFASPLLLAIDLVGTAVKSCLDEIAKIKERKELEVFVGCN